MTVKNGMIPIHHTPDGIIFRFGEGSTIPEHISNHKGSTLRLPHWACDLLAHNILTIGYDSINQASADVKVTI